MTVKYFRRKTTMTSRKVYRSKRRFGRKKSLMEVKNIRGVVQGLLGGLEKDRDEVNR
jgi:hypothetical protein